MMNIAIDLFTFLLFGLLIIVSILLVGFGSSRRLKGNNNHSAISKNNLPLPLPPGPWKLPLIGNIHQLMGKLPHRAMSDLSKKYGPLMQLQIGELSFVVVSSPEIAKQVMDTQGINFANRSHIKSMKILSYDFKGIGFTPYGEYWMRIRRIAISQLFSPKHIVALRPMREEQTSNLIRWIASNEGKSINLTDKVYSLLYTTTTMAAFGKKTEDLESIQKLIIQIIKLGSGFNIVDIHPSIKLLQWISGSMTTLQRIHLEIDRILQKIINDHRTEHSSSANDFMDVLLKHGDENAEFHLMDDNIKAVLLDVIGAGSDTSATTIDWAMSEMMKNSNILRRAEEEVRQVFRSDGYVNANKFDELKYMQSIIKETLRLHPPGPIIPRMNNQRVEINGYEIPAKTTVIVNIGAINRDPTYWQDAECFQPERFLYSLIDYKGKIFEYIPFGAGRRICPGMELGWEGVQMAIAQFLYYFDWALPDGNKCEDLNMKEEFGISVRRKDDLYMVPTIRNPLSIPS